MNAVQPIAASNFYAQLAAEELLETLENAAVTPEIMNAMAALSDAIQDED